MRGKNTWHYQHYTRMNKMSKREMPYINGLAPYADRCRVGYTDPIKGNGLELVCRRRANNLPARFSGFRSLL